MSCQVFHLRPGDATAHKRGLQGISGKGPGQHRKQPAKLAARIAELEKQLADYAKKTGGDKAGG